MTVVQNRSTNKPVSGSLSLGTKKKQPIYISENDARASKAYLRDHPGEIVVLSEADFAKWLMQEYNPTIVSDTNSATPGVLLNDNETTTLYGISSNKIGVPGQPTWDKTQINYVTTDTGIYENITIAFDPSPDDPGDGSFVYHVSYEASTNVSSPTTSPTTTPVVSGGTVTPVPVTGGGSSGISNTPQSSSSNTNSPVGTVTTVSHVSTFFAVEWAALSNAISYTVTVSGNNVPYSSPTSGSTSFVVPSKGGNSTAGSVATGSLSGGLYMFVLNNLSGSFSGTYFLSIQANYSTGSSTGVAYSVTI